MKILRLLKKKLNNKDYLLLHLKRVLMEGSDTIISIHDTTKKFYQIAETIS